MLFHLVGVELMLLSVGDLVDRLVIENIKIFNIREKLHTDLSREDKIKYNKLMMALIGNRDVISTALDEKVEKVTTGQEKNTVLKKIKTYEV